jgi:hypothetical protein
MWGPNVGLGVSKEDTCLEARSLPLLLLPWFNRAVEAVLCPLAPVRHLFS